MDSKAEKKGSASTRRDVIRSIGAAGLGVAAAARRPDRVRAGKAPVNLSFWTWEGPQQRPYQRSGSRCSPTPIRT